ncbi:MAG: ABC transporter ATP-binding protein/permease [Clostridiales bacterium]|nr:ABC transporter ATP-binding protein/permease [Clostridiales bacterium]
MNKQKMPKMPKPKIDIKSIGRLIKMLFKAYPKLVPIVIACILLSSVMASVPAIFQQSIVTIITDSVKNGIGWQDAAKLILPKVAVLASLYAGSLLVVLAQYQLLAYITQGFLNKMRCAMFEKMQNLPVRYFDTNKHGDIMSRYTNDIDTLRQLISASLPAILQSGVIIVTVLFIMLYYSVWLTLVVLLGVFGMLLISRKVGGGSAKYFIRQQKSVGKAEGFIQEIMYGQKVVKVFNHEDRSREDFEKVNDELRNDNFKAHAYANILGPIINNIGNILYVTIALIGGALILTGVKNVGFCSIVEVGLSALSIATTVTFLNMAKRFSGNVNQVAQQLNNIAMALAGAGRVFELIDMQPETDEGYVTLVNAAIDKDGNVSESEHQTGTWAWKHPHHDGTVSYTRLEGDVRMEHVDFAYEEGKTVLHDITLYAKPGQKVAFVGATGAGKTTITNLLNRFYDIEDGKIRYDGININKIKKSDLRRSLGLVLQDTNLFTGTVMENIRYGKLDATDEECVKAAKLAGADEFITRLPQGYQTMLTNNGDNLSQGQRQLLSIARAAVANPPVMILDEATSSIDTRTEQIVQRGMDKLMEGRTVFVIAHRLSTVKNSNVIMVLEHGHIIERGTHEQLLEMKGEYYQLYTGAFELE